MSKIIFNPVCFFFLFLINLFFNYNILYSGVDTKVNASESLDISSQSEIDTKDKSLEVNSQSNSVNSPIPNNIDKINEIILGDKFLVDKMKVYFSKHLKSEIYDILYDKKKYSDTKKVFDNLKDKDLFQLISDNSSLLLDILSKKNSNPKEFYFNLLISDFRQNDLKHKITLYNINDVVDEAQLQGLLKDSVSTSRCKEILNSIDNTGYSISEKKIYIESYLSNNFIKAFNEGNVIAIDQYFYNKIDDYFKNKDKKDSGNFIPSSNLNHDVEDGNIRLKNFDTLLEKNSNKIEEIALEQTILKNKVEELARKVNQNTDESLLIEKIKKLELAHEELKMENQKNKYYILILSGVFCVSLIYKYLFNSDE